MNPPDIFGFPSNKEFALWSISGLALIALADPYPQVAIFIMWLLILGVLLMNASDYIGLIRGVPQGGAPNPAPH